MARGLRCESYEVEVAGEGQRGLEAALAGRYDVIILDLLMPGLSGLTVLDRILQQKPWQAVIVLSCLSDTASRVRALDLGADDYVAKPFSLEELALRVRARIRSARSNADLLQVGEVRLDLVRRCAHAGSRVVRLTEREFLLLRELMQNPGETVPKARLLANVWGYHFDPGSNVIDVYVRRLRAKLGQSVIATVRGQGYRVDAI
ncbi:MAG: response regulator transcription factor [Candidatus Dormibacteraeota bacterium]|nr:response regulator transcription factor [Candidatus Dormibacteraeota bacterium]